MTIVTAPDTPLAVSCGLFEIVTDNPEFKPNRRLVAVARYRLLGSKNENQKAVLRRGKRKHNG